MSAKFPRGGGSKPILSHPSIIVSPKVIPKVVMCEIMSCENIRSDHFGVMLEVLSCQPRVTVTSCFVKVIRDL